MDTNCKIDDNATSVATAQTPATSPEDVSSANLDATPYATDKAANDHYLQVYDRLLADRRFEQLSLLELGVFRAGSMYMWRDYLPNSTIVGLDIAPVDIEDDSGRVHVVQGEQQDTDLLDRVGAELAPDGFDIIIDDASHVGEFTRLSFWHLFQHHLKPGGIYVIEDWGCGYWNAYPDGKTFRPPPVRASWRESVLAKLQHHPTASQIPVVKKLAGWARYNLVRRRFPSHDYGIVGFIKQLIDECGMGDITHQEYGSRECVPSKFESLEIRHGQAVIVKSQATVDER